MGKLPVMDVQEYFKKVVKEDLKIKGISIPENNYVSGNITSMETTVICMICANMQPNRVLELGTFNGRTTTNIADNIPYDSSIITVDLPEERKSDTKFELAGIKKNQNGDDELGFVGHNRKLFQNYPLELQGKIRQFWMDTAEFPVNTYKNYFDLIFIDASHTYDNVINDTQNMMQCLAKGGILLWHDYGGWEVTEAMDYYVFKQCPPKVQGWFCNIKGTSLVIFNKKD